MAKIDPITAAAALAFAGFSGNDRVIMTAIGYAESGLDKDATHKNGDGSTDYGVWQINSKNTAYVPAGFFPPGTGWASVTMNASAAHAIYQAQGLRAWSTYNNGAYQKFLPQAQTANGKVGTLGARSASITDQNLAQLLNAAFGLTNVIPGLAGLPDSAVNVDPATGDITASQDLQNASTSLFSGLSSAMWIGGGALLVILGVVMLAKNEVNPIALAAKALK